MLPNYLYQPQVVQQQNQVSDLNWVQGEAGAKAWIVGAGRTVTLWDSENPVIYLKSADALGMPTMKIFDYTIRENTPSNPITKPTSDYATKDYVQSLEEKIEALNGKIEALAKKTTPRKEVKDE